MKRFIALVLSLVMALSLCVPAWAEGENVIADAIAAGKTEITLGEGEFTLPNVNGKDITLIGAGVDKTVVDYSHMGGYQEVSGSSFVFKNMTIKCAETGYPYPGLQHTTGVSYENCHILGTVNLFCPATFKNCTFDSGEAEHNAVTYGSDSVTFEDCKFTYADRSINCYAEGASSRDVEVTFINCEFTKVAGKDVTGAIETNSCFMNSLTLTITDCTVNEGDLWWVSTYDSENGANTKAVIDGIPAGSVAQVGDEYFKTFAEAIAVGGTVELLTNVTLDDYVPISEDTVINLNGHDIAKTEGNTIFYVTDGAALTINGTGVETISMENADGAYAIWSVGNGIEANEITLNQVTVEATTWGVYHNGNDFGAKVTIEKSTVKGGGAGVFLSGSEAWADPQNNKMNDLVITDSTIEGASAVEVKHGNVIVGNSTLKATAEPSVSNYNNGTCTDGYALALTNNGMSASDSEASTGTVTINSGNFTGKIGIKDDDTTAMVENTTTAKILISGGTFSADPKAYVVDGYAVTETDGKYVVAVEKAETNKVETEVKVDVAAPSVEVPEVNTDGMNEEDKALVENVAATLENPGAVEFDNTALVDAAAEATTTVKNEVTAEEAADLLAEENIPVASDDKVNVVVQPYYDVKVESITVDEDGTASVAMDITPMYQTVVTTADVSNGEAVVLPEDEGVTNAVAVGTPKEMTVTKPVTIKIAIPSTLAVADGDGFKPLYVTHTKEETGVKYVYVATVEKDGSDYTATFVNPNGFSFFTLSTTNSAVAYVKDSDTSYATIESAISDAGKGAVIEVLVSDQVVNITAPCSFKLKWADNITEPTFNVAKGYTMSKWYVNGVYTYIVQSASAGGYAPSTTPEKVVTSADTFDAGIALYVGMSVMAAAGSAVVLKKRED